MTSSAIWPIAKLSGLSNTRYTTTDLQLEELHSMALNVTIDLRNLLGNLVTVKVANCLTVRSFLEYHSSVCKVAKHLTMMTLATAQTFVMYRELTCLQELRINVYCESPFV